MENKPLVSVVIPTYNSEKYIERCLRSIKNQTYKNIEIIVVDKFSKDKTIEIAKKYTKKIFKTGPERTVQKNLGIKNSDGKYLMFIDSDMYLEENVVKECVEICERNKKVGGVCIPVRDVGSSFWVKVISFERELYVGSEIIEAARFLRKDLVEKVGGFDEDIVFYEEFTLPQKIEKLGFNTKKRCRSCIVHDFHDFKISDYLRKKFYYGKTAKKYKERYKDYGNKQINMFYRFGLFFKNKKFYSKPALAAGVITLKSLEYLSAGLGFLASRTKREG